MVQRTNATQLVRISDQVWVVGNLLGVGHAGIAASVELPGLKTQHHRVLVGSDDVDDAVKVGTTRNEEVLLGLHHDLFRVVPLGETERTGTDRDQVTLQGSCVVWMSHHLVDCRAVIHDVLRHDRHQHV